MVYFQLYWIVLDNILLWYRAILMVSLIDSYEIDFIAVIRSELYANAFRDLTTLLIGD